MIRKVVALLLLFCLVFPTAPIHAQTRTMLTLPSTLPWSSSVTYHVGDVVTAGAAMYVSTVAANLNHSPASSPSQWTAMGGGASCANVPTDATNFCITAPPFNAACDGTTDDTLAWRAAITAAAAVNGTIWLPACHSLVNGALQDTSGANAILPMPRLANYIGTPVRISIKGTKHWAWGTAANNPTIDTTQNSGNLIGGYDGDAGGGFPGFTNVDLDIENVFFQGPSNCGIVLVNASYLLGIRANHDAFNCSAPVTNTTGGGLFLPVVSNALEIQVDDVNAGFVYTGFKVGEHANIGAMYMSSDFNGVVFDRGGPVGTSPGITGNTTHVGYLWCQLCTHTMSAGLFTSVVNVDVADVEGANGPGLYDPSNLLKGIIKFNVPYAFGPTTPCNLDKVGGSGVLVWPLQCPNNVFTPPVASCGTPVSEWAMNEAAGLTFHDFIASNDATLSGAGAVTWQSNTGLPGTTPLFTGTGHATTSSTTATNFTGSTPFTIMAWVDGNASASTFMSTLQTGSNFKGWESSLGTGGVPSFFLVNNYPSNAIEIHSAAIAPSTGLHQIVWTYDGSRTAAGVSLYVDGGAPVALTVTNDTLSASTANSRPIVMGARDDGSVELTGSAMGYAAIYACKQSTDQVAATFAAGPGTY